MGRRFSTAEAVAMFRGEGRSITAQRMAVFRALERAQGHPTAEELYLRLRDSVPGLALKTVYAILHELASHRLIEPISVSMRATRWEVNTAPHAHLVCETCPRVMDLPVDPTVLMPLVRRATGHRFESRTVALTVYGRCERCVGR